jgi:hypothetical protein
MLNRDSTGFTDAEGTPIYEADIVAGPMIGTAKIVFHEDRFWIEFVGGSAELNEASARQLEVVGRSIDDRGE